MDDFRIIKRPITDREWLDSHRVPQHSTMHFVEKRFLCFWREIHLGKRGFHGFFTEQDAYFALAKYVVHGNSNREIIAAYRWKR